MDYELSLLKRRRCLWYAVWSDSCLTQTYQKQSRLQRQGSYSLSLMRLFLRKSQTVGRAQCGARYGSARECDLGWAGVAGGR